MNETRGNSRTKQVKNHIFPENFSEGEPLKERENHSLRDSEKTTGYNKKVKKSTKMKIDKWTPFPKKITCKEAAKRNLCHTCFYFLICYPEESPNNN